MKITINGEQKIFPEKLSVEEMLAQLKLDSIKIAVERNLEIVSRSLYSQTLLADGDEIEIVHFIGGG